MLHFWIATLIKYHDSEPQHSKVCCFYKTFCLYVNLPIPFTFYANCPKCLFVLKQKKMIYSTSKLV